jgi:Xaa-Pro aminopeptidase
VTGVVVKEKKSPSYDFSVHALRRRDLINHIKQQHGNTAKGIVLLLGGFERDATLFKQESSFLYYTGLHEPGVALIMDLNGDADLYVPNCIDERKKWMSYPYPFTQESAALFGMQTVQSLGDACTGYQFHPFFLREQVKGLLDRIDKTIKQGGSIFTLSPDSQSGYIDQRLVLNRLATFVPELTELVVDISPIVATMRRSKDQSEIEQIYKAVEITALAQEAAAQAISDGATESEVQASLEYMFIGSGARPAFATIVGSGKNSTILHYHDNNAPLKKGDLVVVDIGAEIGHYCADITRTYPVSGVFTKRQREIYDIVLETQEYIASLAKPGIWLSNKDKPEQSLNHLAKKYLTERGYGAYFPHGIGHFLGLDVHDVGDYSVPLREGDVITIEPGIYIPEENIGIRIEDDYWIVKDGVVCLSEFIPKRAEDIEAIVQQVYADVDDADEEDGDMDEYDG